jgi:hypothetical protein
MPTPDWTVLIDDIATQRLRTCTLCGGQVEQFAVDSWSNGTVLAAVVLCPPCQRRDPQRVTVKALLEHRYHPWEGT